MTAKERRKVKHALKTSVDKADIWLRLAIDLKSALGIDNLVSDINSSLGLNNDNSNKDNDLFELSAVSRTAIVTELEEVKKEISENYTKYMTEIEDAISSIK